MSLIAIIMNDYAILDGLSKVGALPLMITIVSSRPHCVVFCQLKWTLSAQRASNRHDHGRLRHLRWTFESWYTAADENFSVNQATLCGLLPIEMDFIDLESSNRHNHGRLRHLRLTFESWRTAAEDEN